MAKGPESFPTHVATLGGMLDGDGKVQASCELCRVYVRFAKADIERMIAAKGRDYSLIGRRSRCKLTADCRGWVRFHFQSGVYRPLWTDKDVSRWMALDAAAAARALKAEADAVDYSRVEAIAVAHRNKLEHSLRHDGNLWCAEIACGWANSPPLPKWSGRGLTAQEAVDQATGFAAEYWPPPVEAIAPPKVLPTRKRL